MTIEIAAVLAIICLAGVLFMLDTIPSDVVGLIVVVLLTSTGLLSTKQAFSGFGSDTFVLFLGLLIMSSALMQTGVVDTAGTLLIRLAGTNPNRVLLVVMISTAFLSAFMSNTAATAFFLPVVFGLSRKIEEDASQFLLPLAFSSILTSSVTLISTTSNIVVSDLLTRYGEPPLGMFELAPVGIPISVAGIAYLWFVGRRLLPKRAAATSAAHAIGLRPYLSEVMVVAKSPLIGKSLLQSGLGRDLDLHVVRVIRDKINYLNPAPELELEEGDVLLVEAPRDRLLRVKDRVGIEFKPDVKLGDVAAETEAEISYVEAVVLPGCRLIGRTLKGIQFRERFDVQVLGIDRAEEHIRAKISQVRLRLGDVLLLQGTPLSVRRLTETDLIRVLGIVDAPRVRSSRAKWAILIFVASLALGTAKIVALPVAALIGAVLMFLVGCTSPSEAYRDIEWKALILVGAMLALGVAMEKTGTERYLAALLVNSFGHYGPYALMAGFFLLAVVLTQPMSNQAAAVVLVPVAMQTATALSVNPRSFAMMVAVASSCSYITPLEPSCLMVYGPGRYHFSDFVKVGLPLTLLIFVIAFLLVPWIWPLHG